MCAYLTFSVLRLFFFSRLGLLVHDCLTRPVFVAGELLHSLREHLGVVRCLHINNERLVSGGDQKKIVVWDYRVSALF